MRCNSTPSSGRKRAFTSFGRSSRGLPLRGETIEEAIENLKEAVELYLEEFPELSFTKS
ncbi:type II toxin-antitoxin system HicB family antitoxin [Thermococcus gammatolerans]|uniref:HicB-like antitoxin of toxin-antitoxin system domain-containing protein n=1 Tax=Thermococcus gammatolerans (strain DSM 15229 / JCM 11827 / EJ3) TaxID=593117 RepID=C5A256_THEGJ|nr:type II toxin-antitoxin system HicB family antitoxin [Thermococcus gammatolerans]ACS34475.1 Conserved hypothetical protein [Thermococcus gammatolerans EJ3]